MLDDWVDGIQGTPDDELDKLTGMGSGDHTGGTGMGGHGQMVHGTPDRVLGGDAGDVMYPHYLINGRIPRAHQTFKARPGDKARLRFINSGGDTIFKVALGGHRMTVTHTDGFPVQPWESGRRKRYPGHPLTPALLRHITLDFTVCWSRGSSRDTSPGQLKV